MKWRTSSIQITRELVLFLVTLWTSAQISPAIEIYELEIQQVEKYLLAFHWLLDT